MHWLDDVSNILLAQTGDLRQLAKLVTDDITNFYKGQNLAGCDLRGQDLTGLNFENCNIDAAILDEYTKIDIIFDPRVIMYEEYVNIKISPKVERAVYNFANSVGYSYTAWAYKNLFTRFNRYYAISRFEFYLEIIKQNEHLLALCANTYENSSRSTSILISAKTSEWLDELRKKEPNLNCFNAALIGALLSRMIQLNSKKDYSGLNLYSLGLDDIREFEVKSSGDTSSGDKGLFSRVPGTQY
jgi:Pentapeptide repeats (8 copies)